MAPISTGPTMMNQNNNDYPAQPKPLMGGGGFIKLNAMPNEAPEGNNNEEAHAPGGPEESEPSQNDDQL